MAAAPPPRPGGPRPGSAPRATVALGEDSPPVCAPGFWAPSQRDCSKGALLADVNGGMPWGSLEQQLETLAAMQDQCRRSFDDQLRQLSALQSFTRGQAQLEWRHGLASQPRRPDDEAARREIPGDDAGPARVAASGCPTPRSTTAETTLQELVTPQSVRRAGTSQSYSVPIIDLKDYGNGGIFADIGRSLGVSLPPIREGLVPWVRVATYNLLHWRLFEQMMGVVIMLNAVNIGWAIDRELKHQDTDAQAACEGVFLGIFILELCLRIFVQGRQCLKTPANTFDAVLVMITTVTMVVQPLLAEWGGEGAAQYLQTMMILRMLRLLRLARAVRLVHAFRSLWKLVQGLWHCFGTMVSAMLLMVISMYVFACFGAELITKQLEGDAEVGPIVASRFSSLPKIILTLCQFITMDSTAAVYVPLIHRSPGLAIYFALMLIIVSIALMNLVTALLVEDAISKAQMDEEMKGYDMRLKLRSLEPAMRQFFRSLDENCDGYVQVQEVVEAMRTGVRIPRELREIINPARVLDLFEAIDTDQSGDLSENEFVNGLSCVALSDISLETMQILHLLRMVKLDMKRLLEPQQQQQQQHMVDWSNASPVSPVQTSLGPSDGDVQLGPI